MDHAGATPDVRFFGIPRYQPPVGGRSFDYELKYPPDPEGHEASPEARVWATYLDEAEMYDHDMIQGFRDTIDSLLVLAGLFSAIVATFVSQTSQSLKPDLAYLTLLVQIEQNALLRTGGNVAAMNSVLSSNVTPDTPTYTTADLWINGLFFTSLSLSVATALLAVLVKQWCQAYTSVTSGSSREKVLTRQFRFDGLMKWKLPEIVGSLPLLLHLAFAVFFAGLSYFVYNLHKTLSSIVIICSILAEFLYLGSILLPAIWLECPYRIPLLFRPARSLIYFLGKIRSLVSKGSSVFPVLHRYLPPEERPRMDDILVSLKEAEGILLSIPTAPYGDFLSQPMEIIANSLGWLFKLSNNIATQRIVTAALYGCFYEYWHLTADDVAWRSQDGMSPFYSFLQAIPWLSMVEVAFETAIDQPSDLAPPNNTTRSSLRTWINLLDIVFWYSKILGGSLPTPISSDELSGALMALMNKGARHVNLRDALLRWGANFQYCDRFGFGYLHAAIDAQNLENMHWLIDCGCPVNEPVGKYRGSPLMSACYKGFFDAVKLLIENGADVNAVVDSTFVFDGACTPLTISIAGKWTLEAFVYEEEFITETGTALQLAARFGNPAAVRFCLERGAVLTPKIKDTLPRLDWIGGSDAKKAEIEGMLRGYAGRTTIPYCLPIHQHGPILTQNRLA
ncbi:hypothetical protein DL96DRAFT_1623248 [Flagelloscypha sp. PMI_526]|nr:hypothetical protein DL96DRAFT_1623248 [Flagelloscypha sp. PMI_526]